MGVSWEYVRIINKSPYMLSLNFSGIGTIDFPEMYLEDIAVSKNWTGKLVVTPRIDLSNTSQSLSSLVTVNAWAQGELSNPQAQPLTQQAVNVTGSGKPNFSATVGFGSTVTREQNFNIFNPPGSGVNFTFYAARVFTNDASIPTANLEIVNGADQNFVTPVPAVSHSGKVNPPVSFAHCTASDDTAPNIIGPLVEVIDMQQNVTQDFLSFPDTVTISPGSQLCILLSAAAAAHTVRLTMKWTEDIAVPAQGGVITSIATQVIQDGQPAGNPVVEATPSGGPQGVLLTNDGQLTLAKTLNLPVGSFSRMNIFTGVANNVFSLVAHGLGVKPDIVLFIQTQSAFDATANNFEYDPAGSDATNARVANTGGASTRPFTALAIKK